MGAFSLGATEGAARCSWATVGPGGPLRTLLIRSSSLGDVVLTGAVTGGLGPVTFLTKAPWAEVAARLPGVEQVLVLGRDVVPRSFDRVVDLHASPRSRRVSLGRAGVQRVARHDLRRRLRVWLKVGEPPPSVVERYAAAARVAPAPLPWITLPPSSEAPLALGLCPGASAATKRWEPARWSELGARWEGPVVVLGSAEEAELVEAVSRAIGDRATPVAEAGFAATFEALARCRAVVAGDTGLLHLAGACGLPVVGLFGPTTSADGFWTWGSAAVEQPLPCRPCSLHGGPTCPIGDHLCMDSITVDVVYQALLDRLAEASP